MPSAAGVDEPGVPLDEPAELRDPSLASDPGAPSPPPPGVKSWVGVGLRRFDALACGDGVAAVVAGGSSSLTRRCSTAFSAASASLSTYASASAERSAPTTSSDHTAGGRTMPAVGGASLSAPWVRRRAALHTLMNGLGGSAPVKLVEAIRSTASAFSCASCWPAAAASGARSWRRRWRSSSSLAASSPPPDSNAPDASSIASSASLRGVSIAMVLELELPRRLVLARLLTLRRSRRPSGVPLAVLTLPPTPRADDGSFCVFFLGPLRADGGFDDSESDERDDDSCGWSCGA